MKKITDERLVIQNLKNIRILYIIQTIGILCILGYDLITVGFEGMKENPLWLLILVITMISAYLSMSISADHEINKNNPKKRLCISLIVVTFISIIIGFLVTFTDGFDILDGLIIGGIIFVCGLIPIIYVYRLRKERYFED